MKFINVTFYSALKADAKGAIYLTTKNGTFSISLTSFKPHDDITTQDFTKILSASGKIFSNGRENTYNTFSESTNDTHQYDSTDVLKANQKRSINDAVSKNITLVLENLLKNYENSQLPTHGKGKH